jgi:hypothetical protein
MFIIKVTLDLTIKYTRHVHYKSFNSLYSSPLLNMPLLPKTTNQATPTKDHQSGHSHQRPPIRPLPPKTTNQATPTKDHQSDHSYQRPPIRPLPPKTTNQITPTKDHQSGHSHQRPPIRPGFGYT